jgi:hypothetical protein
VAATRGGTAQAVQRRLLLRQHPLALQTAAAAVHAILRLRLLPQAPV